MSSKSALVVIDAQQEYFTGLLPIQYPDRESSIANIATAMDSAFQSGIPVVVIQHALPAGAPVFDPSSPTFALHPEIEQRAGQAALHITKNYASIFEGTHLEAWLREQGVETLVFTGYMTNNCVIGSAAAAEPRGFSVEVLSDATGAIDLGNEAGLIPARQVHETIMALLQSNWAAVDTTQAWISATRKGERLTVNNLVESAHQGRTGARS